ncbi:PREDICTED: structure-specific endonuclease subunit SLX4 [Nanorana parkeri]|uniref:structure-specific endonuclease subunit SLX4 n=1 Tax=Nanorana parkeri TaxID=125878 RepID=UPI00085453BE|nr:PREDICTED: structure-specific endonuclease subunit SLX4 [Nanorana parkeri]
MVESDDEFTELCTKLLKRVKKSKPLDGQSVSTASTTGKSKFKKPKPSRAKSKTSNGVSKAAEQNIKAGDGPENISNEDHAGSTVQTHLSNGQTEKDCSGRESHEETAGQEDEPRVKDLVLERMQQYKRTSPVRMKLNSLEAIGEQVDADVRMDRDLAMALQMDLKKPSTGLEEAGLFFCQLCQKDLTAMSSILREQHVNRCLDQSESFQGNSAVPVVPGCPLCGKPFTTEKARASHLKRCAAKLEVPAQTLLQAVQRQAAETATDVPTGAAQVKRKGVPKKKEPSKKRKVAQTEAEREDLMVAMALSRSLQEEKPSPNPGCAQRARKIGPSAVCVSEKKSRRKKKDKPPPVLLVQAPEEAVQKLQRRLSLLLSEQSGENNLITLPASSFWNMQEEERETFRMCAGKNCVLWDISNMMENRDTVSYYTPELNPPITPWKPLSKKVLNSQPRAVTPTTPNLPAGMPESQRLEDKAASPATPFKDQKPLSDSQKDRQALLDLAELAGEGMTLTQWNYAPSKASNQTGRESPLSIVCSGFIPSKEEVTRKESKIPDTNKNAVMTLMADFLEMVNNPHLSDAQLQTDCGEVLNVHMFVLYARCPLLVEAIHSEGFYVDEGSTGRVRRFLLTDVSAEAALCFLRFLYSAKTDIPSHCLIHVCELARRFGVKSLLDTCEILVGMPHGLEDVSPAEEEEDEDDGGEREEHFLELLKSMWMDENEDPFADQEVTEGLGEEEKVDDGRVEEVDLEEIYEFAATQRRMPEEQITEAESSSELEVGYQDRESEDQSPSNRSQAAGEQPMDIVNQQSLDYHTKSFIKNSSLTLSPVQKDVACSPQKKSPACIHSNSLESSPAVPLLASLTKSQPTAVHCASPVQSPSRRHSSTANSPACQLFTTCSKPSEGPSAELTEPSTAAVHTISLISPDREEDPEADLFTQHSPAPLNDSYDRIFSETCGEYVEPSGLCESSSRVRVDASYHEPPLLTSSPSVIQRPTLPELGSSPNIQPHTRPFSGQSFFAAPENGNSPISICIGPKYSEPTQNSSKVSSTAVSLEQDIILILSSDEETEGSAQTAEVKAKCNLSGIFTGIKESPASFSIRKNSEGHSLLDKSSSSEMSWLVPATPMPHLTGTRISLLQTSHIPQSPKTSKTANHDDTLHDVLSPAQKCTSLAGTLNTTKPASIAYQPPFPNTPEKIIGSHTSTGSKVSCVRSSPMSSIASSTVFEVVDSEEEGAVAEPQADTSACSFQMDYDEPPIPVEEDLWLNVQESPARTYSSPDRNVSLHINVTPTKTPGSSCSTSALQERDSEPDNREDSPRTAASQSKQSSYLNSKLWDEWEDEESDLPAVLPLSQRLNKVPDVQKLLRTPVSIVRKRELPPKVAITPLPEYSDMDTPVLKKELNRFGVRALPKKRMVLKLKEIFSYTHQVMSSDSDDDISSSQPSHRNKIGAVPGQRLPASSKQRAQATATTTSISLTQTGKTTTTVCAAQESESGDEQPPTASQESTTSSVAASDTSSISHSSNTNEFETAFADEDEEEPVPASQAANKEIVTAEAVRNFIENRPDLHKQILLYQPLDLAALHAELKQSGIKIAAGKLLDFLDAHCVTFTTATARKEKMSRRRKKAGKRY